MAKRRILLDITDFANWRGHFTGIQRVIFEVGSHLVDREDFEIQCFTYDESTRRFLVADDTILRFVEADDEGVASDGRSDNKSRRVRDSIKRVLKPMKPLKPVYHKTRHYLGVVANNYVRPTRARIMARLRVRRGIEHEVVFSESDIVLVLGAGWHKRTMSDELARRKQESGFKLATLIHDAIPLIKPELFGLGLPEVYSQFMFEMMIASDSVFAISKSTKADILAFCKQYNIKPPRISVVREGDSFKRSQNPRPPRAIGELQDYVLAVGSFEVRKNYMVLYQAVKEAARQGIPLPKILIVGRKGWLSDDLAFLIENDQELAGRLVHLSNVSDAELDWLYENCLFTVYPSMYEGWGLPIAESLFYEKFCIASSESSMPEVAGDLAEYASPYDPVQFMRLIAQYSNDRPLLKRREERIRKEYHPVRWEQCAEQIAEHLRKL